MVKELGVAYYGNVFPDHAREDIQEMADHGCNSILIAMSEYDWEVWRKNIFEITRIAKEEFNFTVYINFWSWGGVFGGEAPSFFLHRNINYRQVVSNIQNNIEMSKLDAVCPNTPEFKQYILKAISKICKIKTIDGFFWDEPHFRYLPKTDEYFTCRCKVCSKLFKQTYHKEMPITLTNEVAEFKENSIVNFLKEISKEVKQINPSKKVIICLIPPPLQSGISDWDSFCSTLKDDIDVFSSDPYWLLFGKSLKYVEKYTEKTVNIAKKYHLDSQLWCLGFLVPRNKEHELSEAIKIFDKYQSDSIFTWCYRGAEGMSLACRNSKKVWEIIGVAYNELKRKYNL
ncbi:MAG: hypothetical protein ACTSPY_12465 [Candidatus Helarchaeota archaeon]